MTVQQALSADIDKNAEGVIGVSILVVDCNSACLAIVSKMLCTSGYKVVTATRATDALHILRERKEKIDLILTEVHLPDMDKYELLETMREISCLPILILSADDTENVMLGCLFKGAMFYHVKPITFNDVQNFWQFSCMKNRKKNATQGAHSYQGQLPRMVASNDASECRSILDTCEQNAQRAKRKEPEDMDKDEEDNLSSTAPKKRKLVWTSDLHSRFMQAVNLLGIDNAQPSKILSHMNVPGLTKENISSHLQKYRISVKREQDEIQNNMFRVDNFYPWNIESGASEFLNPQYSITRNPQDFRSYYQNWTNLHDSSMSVPSLGSSNSPMYMQSSPQTNQMNTTHNSSSNDSPATLTITSNEELPKGRFDQIINVNNNMKNHGFEEIVGDGVELFGDCSSQQQDDYMLPPLSPLPLVWDQEKDWVTRDDMLEIDEIFDLSTFF